MRSTIAESDIDPTGLQDHENEMQDNFQIGSSEVSFCIYKNMTDQVAK